LMGCGRTELAMSIFGQSYGTDIHGRIVKNGREIDVRTVDKAIANGLAYVTEDRKTYGLILIQDLKENITLTNLERLTTGLVIDQNQEILHANDFRDKFNIKCSSILQKTVNLSGGNQQKVVLSKWLFANPDILILDEPTRGIDVGAKYEIYTIINALAAEGKSIIVISSELPEILGICDRVYVMNEGRTVGELTKDEASQEKIMKCIMQNGGEAQ
jgi:putative multiple sugar transport system ATP-binding protein